MFLRVLEKLLSLWVVLTMHHCWLVGAARNEQSADFIIVNIIITIFTIIIISVLPINTVSSIPQ